MRIYVTHCCAKKDERNRVTGAKVTPDNLYTATPTKRFMETCKLKGVHWAIFSDLYGIWFPDMKRGWYEKDPNSVTENEFMLLLGDFDQKLQNYDEIWFYYNPGRFHRLYARLLRETKLRDKVKLFTHVWDIA